MEFIFFLTYNDVTIWNALDIFEEIKDTGVNYVGFKDVGLNMNKLKILREKIKQAGLTSVVEVVSTTKEENIRSVKAAIELDVDYLIGGTYFYETYPLVKETNIKYFPYIGKIVGHPCLQRGTIKETVDSAKKVEAEGADGIDLLAYRYDGDPEKLMKSVIDAVDIPIIVAGSIDNLERIRRVAELGAWGFTIGSAVLDKRFSPHGTIKDQIVIVLKEIRK